MTRMNEDKDSFSTAPADAAASSTAPADAAASADLASATRRRALLKGLGKSAALAGAAMPLTSLATSGRRMRLKKPNDPLGYNCSVSGNMSVLMSQGTAVLPDCSGKATAHYCATSSVPSTWSPDYSLGKYWLKWRQDTSGNAVCFKHSAEGSSNACFPKTAFSAAFSGGSSTKFGVLCNGGGTADERTWVTALLNASTYPDKFPYSPQEVVKLYAETATRSNALVFFRDYLSSG